MLDLRKLNLMNYTLNMKNLFLINEEEKSRILNLHETATKHHYLLEQNKFNDPLNLRQNDVVVQGVEGDPYQYMRFGDIFWYAKKSDGKNPKWVEVKNKKAIDAIKTKIFNISSKQTIKTPEKKQQVVKKDFEKSKQEKINKVLKYNYTPRIDEELKYIIERNLDNKPFFIYDPKENLLYFFDKSKGWFEPPTLVDYTSVVDGADRQQDAKPFTVSDWCKISKNENGKFLLDKPYNCTDPDTKEKKHPTYGNLIGLKQRFISKGIYSIGLLGQEKKYVGTGKNVFNLKDSEGKLVSAAIHGIPAGLPERLEASKELENLLKKQISSGKVPQEYLDDVKAIASANQSFGCIGVPSKFIDNPKVKNLALNARLFVMGEGKQNFLVQNSSEFFDKLHGDGQQCVDPIMLAQSMGSNNSAVA